MMFQKPINLILIAAFLCPLLTPVSNAQALLNLPKPETMVNLSPAYEPALIKGLTVHQDNPFLFDFVVDLGSTTSSVAKGTLAKQDFLKEEGMRLIKYFFAALTIPEKDLWVNLSPYEKTRMIPQALGETAMGRDLLAQDYMLKQLTASLIHPEKELGKKFWDKVYTQVQEKFGAVNIPVSTFNKVWIVADKASVYEHGQTAFITSSHLKVMLEEDYLAAQKNLRAGDAKADSLSARRTMSEDRKGAAAAGPAHANVTAQIMRDIILPAIENEVNTGKNFATLRQIFNSQILATWFKRNLRQAVLTQAYANHSTVNGVNLSDTTEKQAIYERYLRAYKKGAFNFIKEEKDASTERIVARKYFSGGYDSAQLNIVPANADEAMAAVRARGNFAVLTTVLNVGANAAIMAEEADIDWFMGPNLNVIFEYLDARFKRRINHADETVIDDVLHEYRMQKYFSYNHDFIEEWLNNFKRDNHNPAAGRILNAILNIIEEESKAAREFDAKYGRTLLIKLPIKKMPTDSMEQEDYSTRVERIVREVYQAAYRHSNDDLRNVFYRWVVNHRGIKDRPGFLAMKRLMDDNRLRGNVVTLEEEEKQLVEALDRILNSIYGLSYDASGTPSSISRASDEEVFSAVMWVYERFKIYDQDINRFGLSCLFHSFFQSLSGPIKEKVEIAIYKDRLKKSQEAFADEAMLVTRRSGLIGAGAVAALAAAAPALWHLEWPSGFGQPERVKGNIRGSVLKKMVTDKDPNVGTAMLRLLPDTTRLPPETLALIQEHLINAQGLWDGNFKILQETVLNGDLYVEARMVAAQVLKAHKGEYITNNQSKLQDWETLAGNIKRSNAPDKLKAIFDQAQTVDDQTKAPIVQRQFTFDEFKAIFGVGRPEGEIAVNVRLKDSQKRILGTVQEILDTGLRTSEGFVHQAEILTVKIRSLPKNEGLNGIELSFSPAVTYHRNIIVIIGKEPIECEYLFVNKGFEIKRFVNGQEGGRYFKRKQAEIAYAIITKQAAQTIGTDFVGYLETPGEEALAPIYELSESAINSRFSKVGGRRRYLTDVSKGNSNLIIVMNRTWTHFYPQLKFEGKVGEKDRILVVGDDVKIDRRLEQLLNDRKLTLTRVTSVEGARRHLRESTRVVFIMASYQTAGLDFGEGEKVPYIMFSNRTRETSASEEIVQEVRLYGGSNLDVIWGGGDSIDQIVHTMNGKRNRSPNQAMTTTQLIPGVRLSVIDDSMGKQPIRKARLDSADPKIAREFVDGPRQRILASDQHAIVIDYQEIINSPLEHNTEVITIYSQEDKGVRVSRFELPQDYLFSPQQILKGFIGLTGKVIELANDFPDMKALIPFKGLVFKQGNMFYKVDGNAIVSSSDAAMSVEAVLRAYFANSNQLIEGTRGYFAQVHYLTSQSNQEDNATQIILYKKGKGKNATIKEVGRTLLPGTAHKIEFTAGSAFLIVLTVNGELRFFEIDKNGFDTTIFPVDQVSNFTLLNNRKTIQVRFNNGNMDFFDLDGAMITQAQVTHAKEQIRNFIVANQVGLFKETATDLLDVLAKLQTREGIDTFIIELSRRFSGHITNVDDSNAETRLFRVSMAVTSWHGSKPEPQQSGSIAGIIQEANQIGEMSEAKAFMRDVMQRVNERGESNWHNIFNFLNQAMTANGGIDLKVLDKGLSVSKDVSGGVTLKLDQALPGRQAGMLERVKSQGIVRAEPIILDMKMIPSVLPLLGLAQEK